MTAFLKVLTFRVIPLWSVGLRTGIRDDFFILEVSCNWSIDGLLITELNFEEIERGF